MKKNKLVVFKVDKQQFAIHLSNVERIVRMVEIDPLPLAPDYISGTVNFQGEFIAVINIRKVFLLPQKEAELSDQLIITKAMKNRVALWVDSVSELIERSDPEISNTDIIHLDIGFVEGMFKLKDDMVLIHDPEKFLNSEQITLLTTALKKEKELVIINGSNEPKVIKSKSKASSKRINAPSGQINSTSNKIKGIRSSEKTQSTNVTNQERGDNE